MPIGQSNSEDKEKRPTSAPGRLVREPESDHSDAENDDKFVAANSSEL